MADEEVIEIEKEEPATEEMPEQQLVADETAALTQLSSTSEPMRHSVTPSVSDFTGISNAANLLASLTNWHAQGNVNGLIPNEAGGGVPYAWKLTHMGKAIHAKAQNITPTAPAITGLTPSSTSIAAAAGKPVTIQVNGTGIRGTQVTQTGTGTPVVQPSTYRNKTRIDMTYALPASPGTVQISIYDGATGQTSGTSPLTVTA
jgi:hypothetical protein